MSKLDCHIYGIPDTAEGHAHPYAHILLPLSGAMEVELDGQLYRFTPQCLSFVAPGRYHHCMSAEKILMMNIPESMLNAGDLAVLSKQICIPLTGQLEPLVELIRSEVQQNPDSSSLRYLYYYLYDKLVEAGGIRSLRYIREHFSEEISIARLAELENYNPSYFTDWFKKQTGIPPSAYIRQVRIEKAKELLATTGYRLVDIALQVGYATGASFTRAFKEMEGISPAAYRQLNLVEMHE